MRRVAILLLGLIPSAEAEKRSRHILLRSGWQVVNIGDIGHTPGALALIEKHVPDAEVIVWASGDMTPEIVAMMQKRSPRLLLRVVKGKIGVDGKASTKDHDEAIAWADFFLLGSGSARHYVHRSPLAFKAIMTLPQPAAFSSLTRGFDGECPCCRRRFADA